MSNLEVSSIDMEDVMKTTAGVLRYREILPELMNIKISADYDFLLCDTACGDCGGCSDTSFVTVDSSRRGVVLGQLEKLEKWLFG